MDGRESFPVSTAVEEEEISSSEFFEIDGGISESDNEEEEKEEEEEESEGSLFSIEIKEDYDHDRVFVAVGKKESSMNALLWTLKHAVTPSSTVVHLIHVFPVIRLIPSPLGGMIPKNQACPKVIKFYVDQQRAERKKLLQTYMDACSATKVKVETSQVESNMAAKAILELIPTLNIMKLVLGSNKSSLRKVKSRKGTASQVIQSAPETCEIKIVCKGKELVDQSNNSPSPRCSNANSSSTQEEDQDTALSSPDIRRSPSSGMPISGQVWSILKWVRPKPTPPLGSRKPHLAISAFYENLL